MESPELLRLMLLDGYPERKLICSGLTTTLFQALEVNILNAERTKKFSQPESRLSSRNTGSQTQRNEIILSRDLLPSIAQVIYSLATSRYSWTIIFQEGTSRHMKDKTIIGNSKHKFSKSKSRLRPPDCLLG